MPADTSQISLKIGSLPQDAFNILSWSGSETLSTCFVLKIRAQLRKSGADLEAQMGKPAKLGVHFKDKAFHFYGVLIEFDVLPQIHKNQVVMFTVVPKLYLLNYSSRCRIFQQQTVQEIVGAILEESGFDKGDFEFQLSDELPKREFVVQYNESDLTFIQRLLEKAGIYYFFDHSAETEKIVFADNNDAALMVDENRDMFYYPEVGLIKQPGASVFEVRQRHTLTTGRVVMKDYNYLTPESNVIGQAASEGTGEHFQYSAESKTTDDANRTAAIRAQGFGAHKARLQGRSDCRAFRCGYRFNLSDKSDSGLEGEYLLVSVNHQGSQESAITGGSDEPTYVNSFECMPVDVVFRPPQITSKPVISGVMTARVDGQGGDYAFLDEQGRYRVKFPFDLSDLKNGQASCPVRMAQPYSGANYGMHFPLHQGVEVLVGFVNGDIDRPIAVGSAPNPANTSPVRSQNKSENLLRTASGNRLRMEDMENKTAVEIETAGSHKFSLDDTAGTKGALLKTSGKNEVRLDDKEENITVQTTDGKNRLKLDNKNKRLSLATEYGHQVVMDDKSQSLAVQTKSGHLIKCDDKNKNITIKDGDGKHTIQIDVGGKAIIIKTAGDMSLEAAKNLSIKANKINIQSKTETAIKATGDFKVSGKSVHIKGTTTTNLQAGTKGNFKALKLALEGSGSLDAKGGKTKVSGLTTSLEGRSLTKVRGAVVMIN